jgi:uncharacterized protein DUF6882
MWTQEQYQAFVSDAYSYLRAVQDALKRDFSLGSYERYDWDQETGSMKFSDQGIPKVIADIQFVGSVSATTSTWLWSWDNATILPSVKDRIDEVHAFGERHSLTELTTPKWTADERDGWAMTAISAKILQARGAYCCPRNGFSFFIFTDVRWAKQNGK